MQEAGELLEVATVASVHGGVALYGISYAAVRSVASGGKVCLIALDPTGAETLCKDERIDAAFVYVTAPTFKMCGLRLRARLKEHESTVAKRVAWAQEQVGPPALLAPPFDRSHCSQWRARCSDRPSRRRACR